MQPVSPEEYARDWEPRESQVFAGRQADEPLFRHATWRMVLLSGGLDLDEDVFVALRDTALQFADREALVVASTGYGARAPHLVEWNRAAFDQARTDPLLNHGCTHVFGQSAAWGMVALGDEALTILGGTAGFVDEFLDRAGGDANVRTRFLRSLAEGDRGAPGETRHRHAKALLRMVGWIRQTADG